MCDFSGMDADLISTVRILHMNFFIFNRHDVEVPVVFHLNINIIIKRINTNQFSPAYDPHLLLAA